MNRFFAAALAVVAATFFSVADIAEARRFGGGKSFGAQRQATPPVARSAAPSAAAKAAPGAAAPAGASRWLGPLAGLAAGIGLAALLSHLGLSEGFASFLLLALIVVAGVFLVRLLLARRTSATPPLQYAGSGPGLGTTPGGYETSPAPHTAGAGDGRFEPVLGSATAATPAPTTQSDRYPPGFDPAPFVEQAKLQFNKLQAAYDIDDRKALADVMTPEMYAQVTRDLAGRGAHVPTEVLRLDADLLEVKTEGPRFWASVHFKGVLREDGSVLPTDFEEIWNLTKPVNGSSGWLLAGIEQVASA